MNATGTFEVHMHPLDAHARGTEGVELGRMSIDKTFHGPLSATSKGEMLTAYSPVKGAAGYVAIEQVQGELEGKKGSFVLQHYGMTGGNEGESLRVEVVPHSATGELKGLTGHLNIRMEDEQHYYDFDYTYEQESP